MMKIEFPRVDLAQLPTPIHRLPRLSEHLNGPELWIKRDDQTGLAFGGNKTRKLEFLLGDALSRGARTLITGGGAQSNHCRQTAAAAARLGLDCILVLFGDPSRAFNANFMLDHLLGAEIVWAGERPLEQAMQEVEAQAELDGRAPYLIPLGGSTPLGAVGYVVAMGEFMAQGLEVDRILLASSSGGTLVGLTVGARILGFTGSIQGIRIGQFQLGNPDRLASLAADTAALLGETLAFDPGDFHLAEQYHGGAYGVMSDLDRAAIRIFAQQEGILLDPVYTGKAAGGMLDLIRRGSIPAAERVLFWHTGGAPALFAYAEELLR